MRDEKDIFNELTRLCSSVGYAHVIAFLCFRDNTILYSDQLVPTNILSQFSTDRLLRTEISVLIGLMLKQAIEFTLPQQDELKIMLEKTELLLNELHQSITTPFPNIDISENTRSFTNGSFLRESFFYSGESAFNFQYLEFALQKYSKDNAWLQLHKGFVIEEAINICRCIEIIQNEKILNCLNSLCALECEKWTMLPAFTLSVTEIAKKSCIQKNIVENIFKAFSTPQAMQNKEFCELTDFNITNAYPLIHIKCEDYILFQSYTLAEAIYETPYYWMCNHKDYINQAMKNRGIFTEEFSAEKLEIIFGKNSVYRNVNIIDPKSQQIGIKGEIDVLVIFSGISIILQCKSKRLTIESKKGNDDCIENDFKKGVQDSYLQGLACSKLISSGNYKLFDQNNTEILNCKKFKRIYIFCVLSDHYPSLQLQSRHFLHYETTSTIMPPLVMDIFTLDVMTEMLQSPLYFFSYVDVRVRYAEKLITDHELAIFGCHLKKNLWTFDLTDGFILIENDLSADINLSMMVRREGIRGASTPEGILTCFQNTIISSLIKKIEKSDDLQAIDLGLMLLTLNEKSLLNISDDLEKIFNLTKKDKKFRDISFAIGSSNTGLTFHCNVDYTYDAFSRLKQHCEKRKYIEKASNWFGICLGSKPLSIQHCLKLDYEWFFSEAMENDLAINSSQPKERQKIGRNELCFCGSGIKFKKCCLRTTR